MQSCAFGYHAGGWGKPPVDENGKPLYGDVFGTQSGEFTVGINVVIGFRIFSEIDSNVFNNILMFTLLLYNNG